MVGGDFLFLFAPWFLKVLCKESMARFCFIHFAEMLSVYLGRVFYVIIVQTAFNHGTQVPANTVPRPLSVRHPVNTTASHASVSF